MTTSRYLKTPPTKLKKGKSSHNGSMGLVYLPHEWLIFYDKCSKIYYTSPMDPMGMTFLYFFESRRKTHVSLRFHCGRSFLGYTYTLRGANLWCQFFAECMEYLPTWMASFYGQSLGIHSPSENGNGTEMTYAFRRSDWAPLAHPAEDMTGCLGNVGK